MNAACTGNSMPQLENANLTPFLIDPGLPLQVWPDFPETEISAGTRASIGHLVLDHPVAGLKVGLWEAEANLGRWVNWPCDEFMVIVEGEVVMVEADRETVIGPGECFYIPKGRRCIWNQAGYVKKIMVLFDANPNAPGDPDRPIAKVDPAGPLSSVKDGGGTPEQTASTEVYCDQSGRFRVGLWQTPAASQPRSAWPETEILHIVTGTLSLTSPDGTTQDFGAGDTLLIPAGAEIAWASPKGHREIYCTCAPTVQPV